MIRICFSIIMSSLSYCQLLAATALIPIEISPTLLVKTPSLISIQDNEFKVRDENKNGFITQGIGPCFAIIIHAKGLPKKALGMYHYAPVGSQATAKEAYDNITQALHTILYPIEKMIGVEFEEEEEEPDTHPLYQMVSIAIFGGQPSSQNSIDAITKIAGEQYFPISQLCLNPSQGKGDVFFDLIFAKGKIIIFPFHTE